MRSVPWTRGGLLAALTLLAAGDAASQARPSQASLRFGASAVALWTLVDPALAGEHRSEGYVSQPVLMGHVQSLDGRWSGLASINLEGWTLRGGELASGNSGEGYIDRRHPHTWVHEAIVAVRPGPLAGFDASLAMGRGFAPFGTDDPMVRPFTKYPANHHLAQVLERWIVVGALRRTGWILEAGVFNGDEPTEPEDMGRLSRFGDSWALRTTLLPADWLEVQASHASVQSPEHALGGGLDQRKWSVSARVETAPGARIRWYGLTEWARTREYTLGRGLYTFSSALTEFAAAQNRWRAALRVERTTRPEEERLSDPFRSARPHTDENVVAITRWITLSGRVHRTLERGRWTAQPFLEVSRSAVLRTRGILFDPVEHYGDDRIWNVSLGARIGAGAQHTRMGRYGVAATTRTHTHGMEHEQN